jgi:hypothetical protein
VLCSTKMLSNVAPLIRTLDPHDGISDNPRNLDLADGRLTTSAGNERVDPRASWPAWPIPVRSPGVPAGIYLLTRLRACVEQPSRITRWPHPLLPRTWRGPPDRTPCVQSGRPEISTHNHQRRPLTPPGCLRTRLGIPRSLSWRIIGACPTRPAEHATPRADLEYRCIGRLAFIPSRSCSIPGMPCVWDVHASLGRCSSLCAQKVLAKSGFGW